MASSTMNTQQQIPGITFTGDITVNGPMFDIHDNQHVHIGQPVQERSNEGVARADSPAAHAEAEAEELFHFIHPMADSTQEWQIHAEVKRLVARQGIQEICGYLKQMAADKKILLPQMPSVAYAELVRMGMPSGEGFSEKYFKKHYHK